MSARNDVNALTMGRYYPSLASRELKTDFRHRRAQDPVINTLCSELNTWNKVSVEDALSDLKAPYRSAAPELIAQKRDADEYIKNPGDPEAEQRAIDLKQQLHDMEIKRLELQRQMNQNTLLMNEGNVRLGDLANRKNEVADKLNLVDEEQGIFSGHIGDLNAKNEDLSRTLANIEKDESETQKRVRELGEEKVRLAKKLAEITHDHNDANNHLAQLGARRINVADSLAKLHQDSETYHFQLKDLDNTRSRLNAMFRDLTTAEGDEKKRLEDMDHDRRGLCEELGNLEAGIAHTQGSVVMVQKSKPKEVVIQGIEAPPLERIPPTVALRPRAVPIPAPAPYPEGYIPAPPTIVDQVPPPAVSRGTYDLQPPQNVPLNDCYDPCTPGDQDTASYYGKSQTKDANPKTNWRSSYDVGLTPGSTFPPVQRGNGKTFSQQGRVSPAHNLFNNTYSRSYGRKY